MPTSESSSSDQGQPEQDAGATSALLTLLVALVFVLLIVPVTVEMPFAAELLRVGLTAVLLFSAMAARRRRRLFVGGLAVAAVAVPLSWVTLFIDRPVLFAGSCVLNCIYFVVMAVLILISVIRDHLATVHSIFGAMSSYLLLGLAFAALYWGIDHLDDQAFYIGRSVAEVEAIEPDGQVRKLTRFVYFSFVTMSTLGYGDMTPTTPLSQTLTWMQSVTGQFYMAVLVAWLVSEIPRRRAAES